MSKNPSHSAIQVKELVTENEESVEDAYVRGLPKLKKYISSRLSNDGNFLEAEDIIQEAFVRAYSAKKKQKLKFATAYLFKVARNLIFEHRRKPNNQVHLVLADLASEGLIEDLLAPETRQKDIDTLKDVSNRLSELPPKCRQVFYMRHFSGMSYTEISEAMNISCSTVEKHLTKGLYIMTTKLREEME